MDAIFRHHILANTDDSCLERCDSDQIEPLASNPATTFLLCFLQHRLEVLVHINVETLQRFAPLFCCKGDHGVRWELHILPLQIRAQDPR